MGGNGKKRPEEEKKKDDLVVFERDIAPFLKSGLSQEQIEEIKRRIQEKAASDPDAIAELLKRWIEGKGE